MPDLLDFQTYPIPLNLALFAVAAGIVWLVGTRLSSLADQLAEQSGLGQGFVGLVLLAVTTSLPEISTTATASLAGNPALATNNLLGGVAMQTAVLGLADVRLARGALTFFTPDPGLLLEGTTLVLLLGLVLAGVAAGPVFTLFGVGLWTVLVGCFYLLAIYLIWSYEGAGAWRPVKTPEQVDRQQRGKRPDQTRYGDRSTRQLAWLFVAGGIVLLVAGWTVASVSEALAVDTGLGSSFVGATLLALSTSLPEVSTTLAAVRLGAYRMAFSNIFGSNILMVGLLLPADLLYRQGPLLAAVDSSAVFAAGVGIVVTAVYLIGLIERRDKTVWGLGLDSAAVLVLYAGSLVVLYQLR